MVLQHFQSINPKSLPVISIRYIQNFRFLLILVTIDFQSSGSFWSFLTLISFFLKEISLAKSKNINLYLDFLRWWNYKLKLDTPFNKNPISGPLIRHSHDIGERIKIFSFYGHLFVLSFSNFIRWNTVHDKFFKKIRDNRCLSPMCNKLHFVLIHISFYQG